MTPRGVSDFAHTVTAFVRHHDLLPEGARVLVALSGGPDSCALLLALKEAADAALLPMPVAAAHFHHGLRGRDADEDAAFSAALCTTVGIPCVIGIGAIPDVGKLSPNDAARRARYAFLTEAAADFDADRIATAHTADDQAETVLGRVLRGTSVDGLAGIPVRRPLPPDGLLLVRPLLETPRAEVETYCAAHGIIPRRDPSNEKDRYARARLRKRLPSFAADFNPRLTEALVRLAEHAAADADLLGRLADDLWERALRSGGGPDRVELARSALRAAHPALRRRVLLRAIRRAAEGETIAAEEAATAAFVAALEGLLLEGNEGKAHDLPGGIRARVEGDDLVLVRRSSGGPTTSAAPYMLSLPVPGCVRIDAAGVTLCADWLPEGVPPIRVHRSSVIDMALPEEGATKLLVCSAREGDRIAPLGMGGRTRLVRDVLAEAHVPIADRPTAPLVMSASTGAVLWVVGLAQAESTRVTPESKRIVRLTVEQHGRLLAEGGE